MIVTHHPDGRWLGWVPEIRPPSWLDLEAPDPAAGIRKFVYIIAGADLRQPRWTKSEWGIPADHGIWSAPIATYNQLLRPPSGFARFWLQRERERRRNAPCP